MKPTSILPVKIISTGIFMPGEPVTSTQLEVKYNKSQGWTTNIQAYSNAIGQVPVIHAPLWVWRHCKML